MNIWYSAYELSYSEYQIFYAPFLDRKVRG